MIHFTVNSIRFAFLAALFAVTGLLARAADLPVRREWTFEGVKREALVRLPVARAGAPAPVVVVFHGHGGTMRSASRSQPVHELWPEAVVVFMQGLPTPGRLTDPEGKKPGWQSTVGAQGDRDLKFFDAVLASLRAEQKVDDRRIYSTGHSNGGGFTYLLWGARREVFAAFGPSASAAGGAGLSALKPAPVIHIAGTNDELVKFAWQKLTLDALIRINQCDPKGEPVGKGLTLHASKIGAPVMTYIHAGTHKYPAEATAFIVDFFKAHARP
ncbi:MAG: esterase [Opitutaceae bacterium]